jgi:hypothetical protein
VVDAYERQLVLILADISGYTRFMLENQTSAVHGQLCITTLIETLLREVDIPLQLQEIEGDALFLYAAHPGDEPGWQDVLEQVRASCRASSRPSSRPWSRWRRRRPAAARSAGISASSS